MSRLPLIAIVPLLLTSCGPLMAPMVVRLNDDDQRTVDRMWDNALTPESRLDHALLLDVLMTYSLHQIGVDRLHLSSEKRYAGGRVVMEVDYDRARPAADQFTVTVLDRRGRVLRREWYDRTEVEERMGAMTGLTQRADGEEEKPVDEQQVERERREREGRQRRIEAATQPVQVG